MAHAQGAFALVSRLTLFARHGTGHTTIALPDNALISGQACLPSMPAVVWFIFQFLCQTFHEFADHSMARSGWLRRCRGRGL